jgi:hypothetical protein
MRNLVSGVVGLVWGGAVVIYGLMHPPEGSGAYASGGRAAPVVGVILVIGGAYYLRKGLKEKAAEESHQS